MTGARRGKKKEEDTMQCGQKYLPAKIELNLFVYFFHLFSPSIIIVHVLSPQRNRDISEAFTNSLEITRKNKHENLKFKIGTIMPMYNIKIICDTMINNFILHL